MADYTEQKNKIKIETFAYPELKIFPKNDAVLRYFSNHTIIFATTCLNFGKYNNKRFFRCNNSQHTFYFR